MFRSFSTSLDKFAVEAEGRVGKIMTMMADNAEGLINDVQEGNPVDSGWSRASWRLSKTGPKDEVYSYRTGGFTAGHAAKGNKPPRGAAVAVPSRRGLGRLTYGDRIYLYSAVPYSGLLEEKHGFVKATLQRAVRRIKVYAQELNR